MVLSDMTPLEAVDAIVRLATKNFPRSNAEVPLGPFVARAASVDNKLHAIAWWFKNCTGDGPIGQALGLACIFLADAHLNGATSMLAEMAAPARALINTER